MATINDPVTTTSVAAVKAASTAPAATDPALVVALSPNSSALTLGAVKVTDGTNTAAVKAASAAASAADPALVVALNPLSPALLRAADLFVKAVSVANTTITATLPAAGVGLFHYITGIQIYRNATAALVGSATLTYTTTNLPSAMAWSVGNAMAIGGTQIDVDMQMANPIKSSAANTATTIVAPACGAAVLSQINVYYYTGP